MAIISNIRRHFWFIVLLLGLALAAFILMDATASGPGGGQVSDTTMAKINGETVDYQEFYNAEQALYSSGGAEVFQRRNSLWNYFVEKSLVEKEANALGLNVDREELRELEFGTNLSPIIRARFSDPANPMQVNYQQLQMIKGVIDGGPEALTQAIQNRQLNPNFGPFWRHQEKEIVKQRLQDKLNGLVNKGMYTPTFMAEQLNQEQNTRFNYAYVHVPFDDIENSEVSLSDADYQTYIDEHAEELRLDEEVRKLSFLTFNVAPTPQDSAEYRSKINTMISEFATAGNDSLYIVRKQGRMDQAYVKQSELPALLQDTLMDLAVGTVYGPYISDNRYNAVKIVDRMIVPDSVRSRHILRPANTQQEFFAAINLLDSLKTVIESGAVSFDSLASVYGTDGTRLNGGDLGYTAPGRMVKPFNDLIFFEADQGKLYTTVTEFGVHLVEVTGKKFISNDPALKLGFIGVDIEPSQKTQGAVFDQARDFLAANRSLAAMQQAAAAAGMNVQSSNWLTENDFTINGLGSGDNARDMVKWAYERETNLGDGAPDVYDFDNPTGDYTEKYVIAGLEGIAGPGIPSVADVRNDIQQAVINAKKGALLKERMAGKTDLSALASQFSTKVDTASNANFQLNFITGLGNEPMVVANASGMETGATSAPVVGESGVFVIKMLSKTPAGAATNLPMIRQTATTQQRSQVATGLINSLRENANIKDMRSTFY